MKILTGEDLFNVISTSQTDAFAKFYKQFFQSLLLASDKYVKDINVAEEIVQDVFLKVWENPDSLIQIQSLKSYFYRVVINSSVNHVNRQKNIELHHKKIASDYSEEYLIELDEENEWIMLLHREIEKLPEQCKKVFKLNRFEHLKYKQIATLLSISEKTVENHIGNALKQLRKELFAKKDQLKNINSLTFILNFYLF